MSFILTEERHSVTFDVRSGDETEYDQTECTLLLDVYDNRWIDMQQHGVPGLTEHGNFSSWVQVSPLQGVAVSGLASCGAVILANHDFSRIAAGHMSGDAHFVEAWCDALGRGSLAPRPHFLVWGTGPSGSRRTGGHVLTQYMQAFGIPSTRAPAVAGCGWIALTGSGIAFASAAHSCKCLRSGQAVRPVRETLTNEQELERELNHLRDTWDFDDVLNQFMLLYEMVQYVDQEAVPFVTDDEKMRQAIETRGKALLRAYHERLPERLRPKFLTFKIFEQHPEMKP